MHIGGASANSVIRSAEPSVGGQGMLDMLGVLSVAPSALAWACAQTVADWIAAAMSQRSGSSIGPIRSPHVHYPPAERTTDPIVHHHGSGSSNRRSGDHRHSHRPCLRRV